MADSRIPQHKKRRWQHQAINPPFPVPIATITGVPASEKNWYYFTGELEGDHVLVKHSGDIHFLHKMGFFGRGLMSQGAPDLYKRLPNVFIPQDDGDPCPYKVARRRMFLRHNQWRKSHDQRLTNEEPSNAGEDKEYDSDVEYEPVYYDDRGKPAVHPHFGEDHQRPDMSASKHDLELHERGQDQGHGDTWTQNDAFWRPSLSATIKGNVNNERAELMDQSENMASWDTTNQLVQSKIIASWDAADEGDADFWGCEDTNQSQQAGASSSIQISEKQDLLQHSNDLWEHENMPSDRQGIHPEKIDNNITNSQKDQIVTADGDYESELILMTSSSKCKDVDEIHEIVKSDDNKSSTNSSKELDANVVKECLVDQSTFNGDKITEKGDCQTGPITKQLNSYNMSGAVGALTDSLSGQTVKDISFDSKQQNSSHSETTASNETQEISNLLGSSEMEGEANADIGSGEVMPPKLHPYCDAEDDDADYLVIDDSDSEGEKGLRPVRQSGVAWKSVLKRDPFPIQEPLILSLEEAFFLSYGLGCLTVLGSNKVPLTLCDLWQRCCEVKVKFLPHYIAYHYFRSKGWVPKPGLLFGVDFILYRIGPPFYHGSYSVIVRTVHEGSLAEVEEYTDRKLTWTTFCGLHRVTEHVAKVLMLCYVIVPDSLTEEERKSPECISKFRVKLQVINRWISSQERGREPEEIP